MWPPAEQHVARLETDGHRVECLVDQSKFDNDQYVRFARSSDIDVVITTTEADAKAIAAIEAWATTVVQA